MGVKTMVRRMLSLLLAGILLFAFFMDTQKPSFANLQLQAAVMGDLDGNAKVDASDALTVLRIAAHLQPAAEELKDQADVNRDQIVDAADALEILKYAAKLITVFGSATEAPSSGMVWIPATGKKYHSIPNCGKMNPDKARQMTKEEALQKGYQACEKCW